VLDAHNANLDAMRSELSVQRWLMGLGFAVLYVTLFHQNFPNYSARRRQGFLR